MLWIAACWYAFSSLVTFTAYAIDKRSARLGRRRIAERTLHTLAAVGGWPGAMAAMPLLRHKTHKRGFVAMVWLIAIAHIAAWIAVWWLRARGGGA